MTLDAVTLDLGHVPAPTFVLLDASGLAPLVLPETLVSDAAVSDEVQTLTRQPSADAVRRFATAMNAETTISPFRTVVSAAQGEPLPKAEVAEQPVAESTIAVPVDKVIVNENPQIEKPVVVVVAEKPAAAVAEKPAVAVVEKSAVAMAEKPVVVAIDQPVDVAAGKPVAVAADVKLAAQAQVVEQPAVSMPAMSAEKPVPGEKTQVVVAEKPVVAAIEKPAADTVERPVAVATIDKPEVAVAVGKTTMATVVEKPETGGVAEKPVVAPSDKLEEKAVAAAAHVVVAPPPAEPTAQQVVQASPEVAAVSAASARTEAIVETVNQVVEAVVGQIVVTPGVERGECEIKITLKPTVLDGSEIAMSAKDGALTVHITPTTQEASAAAASALPRLEIALAEHAPAFRQVSVALALKKGKDNEAV